MTLVPVTRLTDGVTVTVSVTVAVTAQPQGMVADAVAQSQCVSFSVVTVTLCQSVSQCVCVSDTVLYKCILVDVNRPDVNYTQRSSPSVGTYLKSAIGAFIELTEIGLH